MRKGMRTKGMKRFGALLMSVLLVIGTAACGSGANDPGAAATDKAAVTSDAQTVTDAGADAGKQDADPAVQKGDAVSVLRPMLYVDQGVPEPQVDPAVPAYTVDPDLGNVINTEQFWFPDAWKKQLAEDLFIVEAGAGSEFYEIYESNRYMMTPNFITVDSLMHTYHLYFAYLLKNIEREHLAEDLAKLTDRMLEACKAQIGEMMLSSASVAPSWVKAAERNVAFFAVGKALLDPGWDWEKADLSVSDETKDIIRKELALIDAEAGIDISPLTGELHDMEDYTQYKPRGYYDTDEKLSRYFRAMMWYGRRNFAVKDESMTKSALLMSLAMDEEACDLWTSLYAVTSFFAGESDDNGICEYRALFPQAYGEDASTLNALKVSSEPEGWDRFMELVKKLDPPAINSVPMWDDDGATDKKEENLGFRFMGQRFSLDAAIFQHLIYSEVKENPAGENRMLPEALDVPAALGSETAEKLVHDLYGAGEYQNYDMNLSELKTTVQNASAQSWMASLYAGWLNTLRPLLVPKADGYPSFMQSEKWTRKDLECFLGSYTELKHDTILYSKQVMAEMGGGPDDEKFDDRGYVEPEPAVYARFQTLAAGTREGLDRFGFLSSEAKRDLERLEEIAGNLMTISVKELKNELPTDDEFEFIRIYGGELEHFWEEATREDAKDPDYFTSDDFPAALVVDIATDPNGSVLQVANDNPSCIVVVVPVDGKLRLARGSVYNFYQFVQPIDKRMTDHEWRVLIGIDEDDQGNRNWERIGVPDKPEWTMDYRVRFEDY